MKDYEFVTITEISRGWFEVDGTKKRMKKEEAITFDQARIAEEEAAKRAEAEAKRAEAEAKRAEEIAKAAKAAKRSESEVKRAEEEAAKAKKVVRKADPEIGMTRKLSRHITVANMDKQTPKLIVINCCDCGAERTIKIQDQFQVKRCPECQKAHRNAMRRAKRAEKKAQQQANQ